MNRQDKITKPVNTMTPKEQDKLLETFGKKMPTEISLITFGLWIARQPALDITKINRLPGWATCEPVRTLWWKNTKFILPIDLYPKDADIAINVYRMAAFTKIQPFINLYLQRMKVANTITVEVCIDMSTIWNISPEVILFDPAIDTDDLTHLYEIFLNLECRREKLNVSVFMWTNPARESTLRPAPTDISTPLMPVIDQAFNILTRYQEENMTPRQLLDELNFDQENHAITSQMMMTLEVLDDESGADNDFDAKHYAARIVANWTRTQKIWKDDREEEIEYLKTRFHDVFPELKDRHM